MRCRGRRRQGSTRSGCCIPRATSGQQITKVTDVAGDVATYGYGLDGDLIDAKTTTATAPATTTPAPPAGANQTPSTKSTASPKPTATPTWEASPLTVVPSGLFSLDPLDPQKIFNESLNAGADTGHVEEAVVRALPRATAVGAAAYLEYKVVTSNASQQLPCCRVLSYTYKTR
jgi:hypothetical protein